MKADELEGKAFQRPQDLCGVDNGYNGLKRNGGSLELALDDDSESDVGERSPQNFTYLLICPRSLITVPD